MPEEIQLNKIWDAYLAENSNKYVYFQDIGRIFENFITTENSPAFLNGIGFTSKYLEKEKKKKHG